MYWPPIERGILFKLFSCIDIESREREREINVKCCRNIDLRKASNPIFSKKYFSQDLYAYLKKKVYSPSNYCTIVQLRQLFFIRRGLFHLIRLKIR